MVQFNTILFYIVLCILSQGTLPSEVATSATLLQVREGGLQTWFRSGNKQSSVNHPMTEH